MTRSLLAREVLPFLLALAALAAAALLIDAVLHLLDAVWIGRYLGIPGMLLIIGSFGYSLRKRKLIRTGSPATLLRLHERMAWAGILLVLVHAGIHFNAILAWLAVWAMLINIGSGLTGKFLLQRARRRLEATRQRLQQKGLAAGEVEDRMYWDSHDLRCGQGMAGRALPDHAGVRRPGHRAHPEHLPVLGLAVKRRWLLAVIAANLVALLVLVFVYPHQMVALGRSCPRMPSWRRTASPAMRPCAVRRRRDASPAMPFPTSACARPRACRSRKRR